MARIVGVNIPDNKHIVIALTYIYGIGLSTARDLCSTCKIEPNTLTGKIDEKGLDHLRQEISQLEVEGDLKRKISLNIKRLMDLGCARGIRHRRGLPVRGQRTRTNARTRKGVKRPMHK